MHTEGLEPFRRAPPAVTREGLSARGVEPLYAGEYKAVGESCTSGLGHSGGQATGGSRVSRFSFSATLANCSSLCREEGRGSSHGSFCKAGPSDAVAMEQLLSTEVPQPSLACRLFSRLCAGSRVWGSAKVPRDQIPSFPHVRTGRKYQAVVLGG